MVFKQLLLVLVQLLHHEEFTLGGAHAVVPATSDDRLLEAI
jgi:hypothetical protein